MSRVEPLVDIRLKNTVISIANRDYEVAKKRQEWLAMTRQWREIINKIIIIWQPYGIATRDTEALQRTTRQVEGNRR
jgi:hypothetical protein